MDRDDPALFPDRFMRLVVLLPVLICVAAPAHAEGARESRYGPTTPRQQAAAVAAAAVRYDGPMLGWANKRQNLSAEPAAAPAQSAPTRPAPVADWAGYQGGPAPVAYAPSAATTPPAPPPPPTSLYAAPRPAPTTAPRPVPVPVASAPTAPAPPPVKDWSNYRSTRMLATSANAAAPPPAQATPPAPANLYAQPIARQAIAPPAAQPRQVAAASAGATGARYYSVGREYGLTPDALPPAGSDSRVLISAGEPPPEARDTAPMHGSADWLAAGVSGDDGDDDSSSAERRAKTRKPTQ